MITSDEAKTQLFKASIIKNDELPKAVKSMFLDELDDGCDYYIPYEIEALFTILLRDADIEYEYVTIPEKFNQTLENIMMDFNYSVEGIYSFPKLYKYHNHPLFEKVMGKIETVFFPKSSGSGNLIEFVHLSSSNFANSKVAHEREFALQDPTAFMLAMQNNGDIYCEDILNFVLEIKEVIDYIAQLTAN